MFLIVHFLRDRWRSNRYWFGLFLTLLIVFIGVSDFSFVFNRFCSWFFLHFRLDNKFNFFTSVVTSIFKVLHCCSYCLTSSCYSEEFISFTSDRCFICLEVFIQGIRDHKWFVRSDIVWQFSLDVVCVVCFSSDYGCIQLLIDFLLDSWFWWRSNRYWFSLFLTTVVVLISVADFSCIRDLNASYTIIDLSRDFKFNFLASKIRSICKVLHRSCYCLTLNFNIEEGCCCTFNDRFCFTFIDDRQFIFQGICNHKFLVIFNICWKFCLDVVFVLFSCWDIQVIKVFIDLLGYRWRSNMNWSWFHFFVHIALVCVLNFGFVVDDFTWHALFHFGRDDQLNRWVFSKVFELAWFHSSCNSLTVLFYCEEIRSISLNSCFSIEFQIVIKRIADDKFLIRRNICWDSCWNVVGIWLTFEGLVIF